MENEQPPNKVKPTKVKKPGNCVVCGQPLGLPGGMAGTGMCGPCCTGEADTIDEKGETW